MKNLTAALTLALLLLFASSPALAQQPLKGCGVDTAIGCIPIGTESELFGFILGWAIGIAGGVAFLLILYAGFMITTSSGDPKRLQAGRELLTSAISGLVLIIFSTFILRLIGVDVLGILQP